MSPYKTSAYKMSSVRNVHPYKTSASQTKHSDTVLADGVDIHVFPFEDALDHPLVALDAGEHERDELKLSGEVHIQVGSAKERQGDLDGKWG